MGDSRAVLVPAGNPSEWTGPTGNNTWLIRGREPALVDAGTGRPEHVAAVAAALDGAPLARVLITHWHPDHVSGLPALKDRWKALLVVESGTAPVPAGDGELEIVPTPGHSPDHLCFFDRASGDLFCGDLVRRDGSIVIPASKGGNLRAYLESLRRVRDLAPRRLLPGHGPIVEDPIALIDAYLAHREQREQQILKAILDGARTVPDIVRRVYPALPESLADAAAESVRAHLVKLGAEGRRQETG
ncbi:MAG TPA: MBL fold metallo-hydrolase [Vicinamibacterales bacterium]|jgi:glyoxylase-like metal-dependent hydrolase (beta-lactamase superfamily II)